MLKKSRPDGTYLRGLSHFTRMLPYLMPKRSEACIYFEQEFDVTHALEYVKAFNGGLEGADRKLTFFQVFLCAAARTIAMRPKMNRFVSGYNHYQRNRIVFNFVAKRALADEGEEINLTIPFSPRETLSTLSARVSAIVGRAKGGGGTGADGVNEFLMRLPRWLIRLVFACIRSLDFHNMLPGSFIASLPFYATIFFTNVGSVGIDAPFHHNFDLGTCGLFVALGKIRRERVPGPDGAFVERDLVKVTFTFDDRIADGIYCGRAIGLFREFAEKPELLETPPDLTAGQLAELMLAGEE